MLGKSAGKQVGTKRRAVERSAHVRPDILDYIALLAMTVLIMLAIAALLQGSYEGQLRDLQWRVRELERVK